VRSPCAILRFVAKLNICPPWCCAYYKRGHYRSVATDASAFACKFDLFQIGDLKMGQPESSMPKVAMGAATNIATLSNA